VDPAGNVVGIDIESAGKVVDMTRQEAVAGFAMTNLLIK